MCALEYNMFRCVDTLVSPLEYAFHTTVCSITLLDVTK